ncbi:MAG TPA: hypothetical protein VN909_07155 [Candidatus Dormibacteraeota bacterium]|nr:hypothetical protein [Candidatus Dormibacteraeota bacterium]
MPPLDYLAVLSDDVGVLQHAVENVPNRAFGYCTDDVARAFMVALAHQRLVPSDKVSQRLASTYLAFLHHAQLNDGRFHNFMAYDRTWLDEIGTHDSCGRAIWALGYGVANAPTESWRRVCAGLLDRALPSLEWLEYIRSRAYAALGLAFARAAVANPRYSEALRFLSDEILASYDRTASGDWRWFEDRMTYDNARLPEALIRAGQVLDEPRYAEAGLGALAFCEGVTLENGIYVPIGNDGWYERGATRARYAQQPLEACAMVDAELAAFDSTGDAGHFSAAELALEWFYGKNSRGIAMANGGGCYDGLEEDAVNANMGAESTLALLSAAYAMAARRARVLRAVR